MLQLASLPPFDPLQVQLVEKLALLDCVEKPETVPLLQAPAVIVDGSPQAPLSALLLTALQGAAAPPLFPLQFQL